MSGTVLGSGDAAESNTAFLASQRFQLGERLRQALTMQCQKRDDGEGAKKVSLPRLGERKPSWTWCCPS